MSGKMPGKPYCDIGDRTGRRAAPVLLSILLTLPASACIGRSAGDREPAPRIVWPPPPAAPRIEYELQVRGPRDLGIRRNWVTRLFRYLGSGRRAAGMARPFAIAVTPEGRIAVADPDSACVHLFDPERSEYLRLTAADGAPLESPVGVAAGTDGSIYVSDSVRNRVFRFSEEGEWIDSVGDAAGFSRPTGLSYDRRRDRLFVVDTTAHRIVDLDGTGKPVRIIGTRGTGDGEFNFPVAVAVDDAGRLFVTDSMNFRIQVLDSDGRFLRAFGRPGDGPGDFDKAKGIAVDPAGHIYVVEALHDVIHVYDPDGRLLTVIGGTGTGAGEFWLPAGIAIDDTGRIWIADSANHRLQVLRILEPPGDGGSG